MTLDEVKSRLFGEGEEVESRRKHVTDPPAVRQSFLARSHLPLRRSLLSRSFSHTTPTNNTTLRSSHATRQPPALTTTQKPRRTNPNQTPRPPTAAVYVRTDRKPQVFRYVRPAAHHRSPNLQSHSLDTHAFACRHVHCAPDQTRYALHIMVLWSHGQRRRSEWCATRRSKEA